MKKDIRDALILATLYFSVARWQRRQLRRALQEWGAMQRREWNEMLDVMRGK